MNIKFIVGVFCVVTFIYSQSGQTAVQLVQTGESVSQLGGVFSTKVSPGFSLNWFTSAFSANNPQTPVCSTFTPGELKFQIYVRTPTGKADLYPVKLLNKEVRYYYGLKRNPGNQQYVYVWPDSTPSTCSLLDGSYGGHVELDPNATYSVQMPPIIEGSYVGLQVFITGEVRVVGAQPTTAKIWGGWSPFSLASVPKVNIVTGLRVVSPPRCSVANSGGTTQCPATLALGSSSHNPAVDFSIAGGGAIDGCTVAVDGRQITPGGSTRLTLPMQSWANLKYIHETQGLEFSLKCGRPGNYNIPVVAAMAIQ